MNLLHNIVTGLKIFVSYFYIDFFNGSEVIAFFAMTDFCLFYIHFCVKLKNHQVFSTSDYLTWKNVWRANRINKGFVLKISFMTYKIYFSGQINRFHLTFLENRIRARLLWTIYAVTNFNVVFTCCFGMWNTTFPTKIINLRRKILCVKLVKIPFLICTNSM